MSIVLLILKIIGIVLAVILSIAVIIVLILLFAPAKYKFNADKGENFEIDAKFTWLFSIISVQYNLKDNKDDLKIRIPFLSDKKEDKPKKDKKEKKTKRSKAQKPAEVNVITNKSSEADTKDNIKSEAKKQSYEDNISSNESRFTLFKNKLKEVIDKIKEVISELIEYKNKAVEFDLEFGIKRTVKAIIILVLDILKALKPRVFKIDGVIGFDKPSDTGMALGALAMVLPLIPYNINIDGDFERKIINGNIRLKGSTNLFLVLIPIIKFIMTKPIWVVIKKYWG